MSVGTAAVLGRLKSLKAQRVRWKRRRGTEEEIWEGWGGNVHKGTEADEGQESEQREV